MQIRILFFVAIFSFSAPVFSQEKIHTCINERGEKLFSVKAHYLASFSNGMAEFQTAILENNKPNFRSGFVDEKGKIVIDPRFEKVYPFAYGVTWVKEPGADGYYLINKKGERLTTQTWKKAGYFIEGFAEVFDANDKMGFVNRRGELVIPCNYLGTAFSEGLACVMPFDQAEEKYGFIDTTGKLVIPYQYKQPGTSSFDNGECRVMIGGVVCLINHKGEVAFKPTLTKNSNGFSNGLSASYTNYDTRSGWGYYNRKNEWVIKPQFENANDFSGGLAVVQKGGKYGVIDTTGKVIIPIQYANIFGDATTDGWFGTEMVDNGTKTYLNAMGRPFASIPVKYVYQPNGHSILPFCDEQKKYGYLKLDGSLAIAAQFDNATTFHEGKSWVTGNTSSLKTATGVTDDAFVKEYVTGEKVYSKKGGKGEYYPGTVKELSEYYYLIMFDNGSQEWVTFGSIKRR